MVPIRTMGRLIILVSMISCSVITRSADSSEIISEVIPLKYAKAKDVATLLDQSTPAVTRDVIADIRSNSLLVFGSKEQIEKAKHIASTADVALPLILIEAAVLELESPNSRKAGVQRLNDQSLTRTDGFLGSSICWFTNLAQVAPTNNARDESGGFTHVAGLGNGLNSTVAALIDKHQVKIIQKPRIQTSSGMAATLFIDRSVACTSSSGADPNSGCPHCRALREVGLGLEILPTVAPDGAIALGLAEKSLAANVATTLSTASVKIQNGDMLLIGGATRTRKQQFPPIAGRGALLDRSNHLQRTELVIVLRFAVLPPSNDRLGAQ